MTKVWCRAWWEVEDGQGMVEYAVILVLVAAVVIGTLSAIGPGISDIFKAVQSAF